jgi:hypothetical protein
LAGLWLKHSFKTSLLLDVSLEDELTSPLLLLGVPLEDELTSSLLELLASLLELFGVLLLLLDKLSFADDDDVPLPPLLLLTEVLHLEPLQFGSNGLSNSRLEQENSIAKARASNKWIVVNGLVINTP